MKYFSKIIQIYENRAKKETLVCLRAMSNRQLLDCGISPDLLAEGVKAWPWRELPESLVPLQFSQISMLDTVMLKSCYDLKGKERPVEQDAA